MSKKQQAERGTRRGRPKMRSTVEHIEPDITVIKLFGDLDAAEMSATRELLLGEVVLPNRAVLVDLSEVPFIDSSGISLLVSANREAETSSGHLALVAPTDAVREVLELERTAPALRIADDVGDAVLEWTQEVSTP